MKSNSARQRNGTDNYGRQWSPSTTEEPWSAAEVVTLTLASGQLCVRQIAQGQILDVWDVGGPGRFHVRVAWREMDEWDPESDDPEAFQHAQFWPALTS